MKLQNTMAGPNTDVRTAPDIPARPWKGKAAPRRVLAIRLQALGDLVITLPYLQQLKKELPADTRLDLLTREEVAAIPRGIDLFDKVFALGGGRNPKKQVLHAVWLLPRLLSRRYDVIIDLQNNYVSRFVRKALLPKGWSSFDRYFPIPAGERTRLTIIAAGLPSSLGRDRFVLKEKRKALHLLQAEGWKQEEQLVILNPAGAFITRNWPIENYARFAALWLERFPRTRFLIIGLPGIAEKAAYLKSRLQDRLINLVGSTTALEAFAIVQLAAFVLSEDGGLMHMAWVSGVPTLAMFGSTSADQARPLGEHSLLLHSSDLPCGNCMQETCRYGDTHCLTRYTPEFVFEKAMTLR